MKIDFALRSADLSASLRRLWQLSALKLNLIRRQYDASRGSPVFTVKGRYTSRPWAEWTQGFQYGSEILQFDATDEREFLQHGRSATVRYMAAHVGHFGVHDHGFNNVSTYGNLWRLMNEGRIADDEWERHFYEL